MTERMRASRVWSHMRSCDRQSSQLKSPELVLSAAGRFRFQLYGQDGPPIGVKRWSSVVAHFENDMQHCGRLHAGRDNPRQGFYGVFDGDSALIGAGHRIGKPTKRQAVSVEVGGPGGG